MNCVGEVLTCELPECGRQYAVRQKGGARRRYCSRACKEKARRTGIVVSRTGDAMGPSRPLLWATEDEERARRVQVACRLWLEGLSATAIGERLGFRPEEVRELANAHGLPKHERGAMDLLPFGSPA